MNSITNEIDFEKAFFEYKRLRLLSQKDPKYKKDLKEIRDIIEKWEKEHWSDISNITDEQIEKSDLAEKIILNRHNI